MIVRLSSIILMFYCSTSHSDRSRYLFRIFHDDVNDKELQASDEH